MDTGKFDDLTRAFGRGASRRSILKRLLGMGGAAVAGSALFDDSAEAARRPTPTPRPIRCPGDQIVVDGQCQCPDGTSMCGPACCPDFEATCCDNACCYGICYGEELCCVGAPAFVCNYAGGITCCAAGTVGCCTTDGCCDGVCYGGINDFEFCCPAGSTVIEPGHCCPSANDVYCAVDGCCAGACYGGESGQDFCCPTGSFVIEPGHCCPSADDSYCAVDGCCAGACYGGESGADFCCLSTSALCNESECCDGDTEECCSEDGCCAGECYGGSDDTSFCCTGIFCDGDSGLVCVDEGSCCHDDECPNDPVTCQTGVCQDYTCGLEGGGCGTNLSCCGGDCCAPGDCCQNEGGNSICLTNEPGFCCTVDDCTRTVLPCWETECQYDSESGLAFCVDVNACFGTGEICCNNVCIQGTTCPECSQDSDCPSQCSGPTTALIGACVQGKCVSTPMPCQTIDPCLAEVCQDGQCVFVGPDTCNPKPGTVCCPAGWTCPVGGTECVCSQQYQCTDGRCGQCCVTNDCISNERGSLGCIECQGASCVAINDGGSCNDGFGTCNGGYCFNQN